MLIGAPIFESHLVLDFGILTTLDSRLAYSDYNQILEIIRIILDSSYLNYLVECRESGAKVGVLDCQGLPLNASVFISVLHIRYNSGTWGPSDDLRTSNLIFFSLK